MADYTIPVTVTFDVPDDGATTENYPYQAGIAGEEIDPGEAVYRDSTNRIRLAHNQSTAAANMIGIAANHVYAGQLVSVGGPRAELLGGSWGALIGQDVHLSNTPGKMCPLADVDTANGYMTRVGKFTEAGRLVMNLEVFGVTV